MDILIRCTIISEATNTVGLFLDSDPSEQSKEKDSPMNRSVVSSVHSIIDYIRKEQKHPYRHCDTGKIITKPNVCSATGWTRGVARNSLEMLHSVVPLSRHQTEQGEGNTLIFRPALPRERSPSPRGDVRSDVRFRPHTPYRTSSFRPPWSPALFFLLCPGKNPIVCGRHHLCGYQNGLRKDNGF